MIGSSEIEEEIPFAVDLTLEPIENLAGPVDHWDVRENDVLLLPSGRPSIRIRDPQFRKTFGAFAQRLDGSDNPIPVFDPDIGKIVQKAYLKRIITNGKNYLDSDSEERRNIVVNIISRCYGEAMGYKKARKLFGKIVNKLVESNPYEELKLLYSIAKTLSGKLVIDIDRIGRILTFTESPKGYDGGLIREYTVTDLRKISNVFGNSSSNPGNYKVNPERVEASRKYDEERTK